MKKKMILVGLLAGLAMLVVGTGINWLVGKIFPALALQYQNPGLFRPWSDPLMSLIFVEPLILGLVLVWLWSKVKTSIKGRGLWVRGVNFGVFYWLLSIPGMFISYSTFPVSLVMVISWSISGFAQGIVAGWIFSKLL